MLLARVLEFESHRGEILNIYIYIYILQKNIKKGLDCRESAYRGEAQFHVGRRGKKGLKFLAKKIKGTNRSGEGG